MILFKIIIPVILGVVGMFWLASFLTYRPNYKYYKLTYDTIKNKEYLLYLNDENFIKFRPKDKMNLPIWQFNDDEILYFKQDETIKLKSYIQNGRQGYIHKDFMPFFDPYTQYWHWKIKKEMLLHTRSIAEIREDKLKQLKI
jgi:hypothetical protein